MKKSFISVAALVALTAGSALAEDPTVKLGGFSMFEAAQRNQKSAIVATHPMTTLQKKYMFNNLSRAHVSVDGKTDFGMMYGANIGLQTNNIQYNGVQSTSADRTYVYMGSDMGRLELGSNYSSAVAMKLDAATIARASGGVDGTFINYAYIDPKYVTTPHFYPDSAYANYNEDARRVTYFTPKMSGLQAGVSFTPDNTNSGVNAALTSVGAREVKNLVSGGISYETQFNDVKLSLSAIGEDGKSAMLASDTAGVKHNYRAYQVGGVAEYSNFAFAASYGSTNKKFLTIDTGASATATANKKDGKYYTVGGAYAQGPVEASVTYLNSTSLRNKFNVVSVGVDYKLANGLVPYVEYNNFRAKSNVATDPKNNGTVFIIGTALTF